MTIGDLAEALAQTLKENKDEIYLEELWKQVVQSAKNRRMTQNLQPQEKTRGRTDIV